MATIRDGGRLPAGPLAVAVAVRGTTLPGWSGSLVPPAGAEFEAGGEYQLEAADGAASDETLVADLRAGRTTGQHLQQKLRGLLRGGAAGHFIRASHCPDGRPRSPAV